MDKLIDIQERLVKGNPRKKLQNKQQWQIANHYKISKPKLYAYINSFPHFFIEDIHEALSFLTICAPFLLEDTKENVEWCEKALYMEALISNSMVFDLHNVAPEITAELISLDSEKSFYFKPIENSEFSTLEWTDSYNKQSEIFNQIVKDYPITDYVVSLDTFRDFNYQIDSVKPWFIHYISEVEHYNQYPLLFPELNFELTDRELSKYDAFKGVDKLGFKAYPLYFNFILDKVFENKELAKLFWLFLNLGIKNTEACEYHYNPLPTIYDILNDVKKFIEE